MASRIVSVILFILGAALIFLIPTQFTMASFSGGDYFLPVFVAVVSAVLLFFGNKVGKYKTNRYLGTAVFVPGLINIFLAFMNPSLTGSQPSQDPNYMNFIQYYPKGLVVIGIAICVIGVILFVIKGKSNNE